MPKADPKIVFVAADVEAYEALRKDARVVSDAVVLAKPLTWPNIAIGHRQPLGGDCQPSVPERPGVRTR